MQEIKKRRIVLASVLKPAEQSQDGFGSGLFPLRRQVAEDFLDGAQLLGFVVDDEVPFVSKFIDVLPQDSNAERMKGANRGA